MYKIGTALPPDGVGRGEDHGNQRVRRQVELKKLKGQFGATLAREGKHIIIATVAENSAAYKAGLLVGDMLEQAGSISVRAAHDPIELGVMIANATYVHESWLAAYGVFVGRLCTLFISAGLLRFIL